MVEQEIKSLSLPCLRGIIGDWFYYVTVLNFQEVLNRVKLPEEIDKKYKDDDLKLGDWIQRKLEPKRTKAIVDYLHGQEQRFFNSLILGIYNGKPYWQDLNISTSKIYESIDEVTLEYFSRTFGILTLNGDEDIFAIDGQHRAIGIREAVKKYKNLGKDEVTVIFVAHRIDEEGKKRTRRLFSTLNRYAKPVSHSEIIALSEDNNCAVITRNIIETSFLQGKVIINKAKPINVDNKNAFTNILTLYDIVKRILTDESVIGFTVSGKPKEEYTTSRIQDRELTVDTQKVLKTIETVINTIPSVKAFFAGDPVNRRDNHSNLIFRPIGQDIIFDVLKIATEFSKVNEFLVYLKADNFNLANPIWNKIFWDQDTNNISTEKPRQKAARMLILEALDIPVKRTKKDLEVHQNLAIQASDLKILK